MRKVALFIVLTLAGSFLGVDAGQKDYRPPSQVIRPAAASDSLEAKLVWALGEIAKMPKAGPARTIWVGYSIDRLMGERSHIGTSSSGGLQRGLTVAEVLGGKTTAASPGAAAEDVRKAASAALEEIESRGKPEKKVIKELGFFLKYEQGKPQVPTDVRMSNLDLTFEFEGAPLYWLGKAPEPDSLALIRRLFTLAQNDDIRQDLIAAAGCHGSPALVIPFLADVMTGDASDELRKDAAFWIGQQNDAEGLRLLVRTARSDRSEEVREGAVFSISQTELAAAVDELIALARSADRRDVRKNAVFWLGQMASEKSGKALEQFAREDGDFEVQEQAVFALSQLPDNQGVDALIKLAKTHPDPRVRKKAVFWLGECDDPRALDALIAIIKGK